MVTTHIDLIEGTALAGDHLITRDGDGWWGLDLAEAGHIGDPGGDTQGDAWWSQAVWVRAQTIGATPAEAGGALERLLGMEE